MKITKKNVCLVLNEIQEKHSSLFDDLILLKNFNSKKFDIKSLSQFQYNLGLTLYRLAATRKEIIAEEKKLILQKKKVNAKWFVSRMKLFKKFKDGIDQCIIIGKSLGDVFVVHFYQLNLPELFNNLDFEPNQIFPTGIGGIGELKLIQNHFLINRHFLILHGISNLLRVGDVSIFNMDDGRLTSIGEIKTKSVGENKISLSLSAVEVKDRKFFSEMQWNNISVDNEDPYKDYFDPERFKRQMNKTYRFLQSHNPKDPKDQKVVYEKYHVKELEEVVEGMGKRPFSILKINSSLLYSAVKTSSNKISKRIFKKEDAGKLKKYEGEIERYINSIFDKDRPNHPIRYGSIHFDKNHNTNLLIGTLPLFWYRIKPSVLKEIYFHNVFVVTLFNPTSLYSRLNEKGIEFIKDERSGKYFIGKKIGKAMLKFERFTYFLYLIENCLHTEEAVISLISEVVTLTESHKDSGKNMRVQPEILHFFTNYNMDNID